jgi:hypothetical protein
MHYAINDWIEEYSHYASVVRSLLNPRFSQGVGGKGDYYHEHPTMPSRMAGQTHQN